MPCCVLLEPYGERLTNALIQGLYRLITLFSPQNRGRMFTIFPGGNDTPLWDRQFCTRRLLEFPNLRISIPRVLLGLLCPKSIVACTAVKFRADHLE